jgi:hypothetical protein
MSRIQLDSTSLASVAYSAEQRLLEVVFQNGKVYDYFDVPSQTYSQLLGAKSKGHYFNHHIRNHFRAVQVRTLAAVEKTK